MEKLGDAGPFLAFQVPFDRLVCLVKEGPPVEQMTTGTIWGGQSEIADLACATDGAGEPIRIRAHLSAEFAMAFSSPLAEGDKDLPDTRIMSFKPILFFRLHENVDAGIGLGPNRFSGTDVSGNDFQFWRWSVPMRARITWPWMGTNSRWRALYLSIQTDYFPGEFTRADFRPKPGRRRAGFREADHMVRSVSLGVDVIKVLTGRWRFG